MNDLHRALGDIRNIRRQMAHSTEFRGYGPVTLAATGVVALVAAGIQALWLPNPEDHIRAYIFLWIATAILSASLIGVQTVTRTHRIHSGLADAMIRMAVEQFLPCVGAGALVTYAVGRHASWDFWLLPGLWQIVFSLGIFASCRFLPRPVIAVGVWYLLTGFVCLSLGDARALSPWTMGIAYGVGQLLVAAILFVTAKEAGDEV
jgi:hypothetical protein